MRIGEADSVALIEALLAGKSWQSEEDLRDEADRQERLNEILERLGEIDADAAPGRAGTILAGL